MLTKNFSFQYKKISYHVYGQGKTVVLLHGFGEDSSIWQPQINFLQNHFRLIVPDLPGSGQSELIPNANIETYTEIIKDILDIELEKVSPTGRDLEGAFIGHSMGGYITLAFAEKYPQYLNGFGLFHSSAFADSEEKKVVRKKAIEFIKENGAGTFLKTSIPGLFTKEYAAKQPEKMEELIEKGNDFTAAALIQYYEAMIARPDRTAVLTNSNKPILFIIGEQDTAVPLQSSLQQCYLPAQSHVHILASSAHIGMWEEEDKANKILLNFLSGIK